MRKFGAWSRVLFERIFVGPDGFVPNGSNEINVRVLLELIWSKDKILEFYLNSVDWGPGIIGAEAASLKYFHCHALDLNSEQSALLAAVLPGPHLWRPDRPSDAVKRRVERIRQEMEKVPLIGPSN